MPTQSVLSLPSNYERISLIQYCDQKEESPKNKTPTSERGIGFSDKKFLRSRGFDWGTELET